MIPPSLFPSSFLPSFLPPLPSLPGFFSFAKYLLNAYYVLDILLDAGDLAVNKKNKKFLPLRSSHFRWRDGQYSK